MSKITKSSTKDEILKALDEANEEQEILHLEVETLQKQADDMNLLSEEKVKAILNLEELVQEEDVKKKGLIKQLASQTSNIELAKKKTEKYIEIKETLKSVEQELESVKYKLVASDIKIDQLTAKLESFKNRALPSGIKKGFRKWFNLRTMFVETCAMAIVIMMFFGIIYVASSPDKDGLMNDVNSIISRVQHNVPIQVINPLAAMTFTVENGIVTARHNGESNLKSKDGVVIDDSIIATWALKAGFDGVLFGTLTDLYDRVDLERDVAGAYENSEIDIEHVASKFKELGCSNVLALVGNKGNLTLPEIFSQTSQGKLEVFESRRKLASFIPVFWGKEKKQMNIKSDNVYAYITSDEIFMEIKGIKAYAELNVIEEETPSDK